MNVNITGPQIFYEIPILGGIKITESHVNSLFVILLVFVVCKVLTFGLKVTPTSKRQIIAEFIVEKCRDMVSETMGDRCLSYTPFVMGILALVGLSNLLGLLGMYPPTADVSIPLGWSITVFIIITKEKMKGGLGGYVKGFLEPIFVFAPLNLIGEVALPISMAFRLFGNILSGVVISELLLTVMAGFSVLVLSWITEAVASYPVFQIGIPAVFSLYFDVFSGCLQAYVFATLAMLNISMAGSDE